MGHGPKADEPVGSLLGLVSRNLNIFKDWWVWTTETFADGTEEDWASRQKNILRIRSLMGHLSQNRWGHNRTRTRKQQREANSCSGESWRFKTLEKTTTSWFCLVNTSCDFFLSRTNNSFFDFFYVKQWISCSFFNFFFKKWTLYFSFLIILTLNIFVKANLCPTLVKYLLKNVILNETLLKILQL